MMARESNDEVADIPGEEEGEQPSGDDNDAALALEAVEKFGQPAPPPAAGDGIHCLTIIGQVEGHVLLPPKAKTTKYEHVIPQLVAVEQNPDVKGLLIILNTVGGDIEAGLAIAEMIKSLSKPKVSLILGGGHSIGGPIAVAADRSFIAGTATVTVHPIRLSGLVIGVPQTYEYLDKMQDRVVKFIVENSSIDERHFRELMFRTGELMRDVGTVLVGEEAVRVGLIDEIGGIAQAFAYLRDRIHGRPHAPEGALLPHEEAQEGQAAQEAREGSKNPEAERSRAKPFVPSVDPVIPMTVEPPHDDPAGDRPW